MSETRPAITLTVNGESRTVCVAPMKRLLDVLREDLLLTGAKEGCGEGECGSCSVRMDGELVNSCLVPILQAEGATIQTVEGLASNGMLHPLQESFLACGGAQCGICTPGMLMAAAQLIERIPHPSMAEIREGLAGNLCRCTGFMRIFESVLAASTQRENQEAEPAPMRGNAHAHQLIAPGSLPAVLELLAAEPGVWTPMAGGTEIMVAHAAGKLNPSKLVSLWGIGDLRFIKVTDESVAIGAGSTFVDLRRHAELAASWPLLARAAAWIGSIANQSRATLGGNLVNGSPAADSSPALLVYDAEIEMISVRGRRRIPYCEFHTGYKRNQLAQDELVYALHLPRRFARHRQYLRKVGTRRAMAISKVALAGTALLEGGIVTEIRLGAASLAAFPARLYSAEKAILGRHVTRDTIAAARLALMAEAAPIDDIRSTALYRKRVAANLVEEFLLDTGGEDAKP